MRPEESRALFEGYGDGAPRRRRGPIVLGVVAALAVGAAIGAGSYAWYERGRADDALVARGQALAEREAAETARTEAIDAAEKVAVAAQEAVALAERQITDANAVGELLAGVVTIWAGGTPELAPPAVHELLRGEVLKRLEGRVSEAQYLGLVGAAVRAMAIDVRARDSSRVRVDFDFAKEYLSRAQKLYAAESPELAAALRNIAAMCFAYQSIPALDEPARVVLRENARMASERALAIEGKSAGRSEGAPVGKPAGRAVAESLATLGRLSRLEGDAAGAAERLTRALDALGADAAARERAAVAIDLARAEIDLGKRDEAFKRLGDAADRLAREVPFGDELELDARALRVSLLAADDAAAMAERLALGRVLVQLRRAAAGYDALAQVVRFYAADATRFRERLEAAVWLARALDQMGSSKAALELLDQPRIVEDARVFGGETLLAKEYETTRAVLRMRLAARQKQ